MTTELDRQLHATVMKRERAKEEEYQEERRRREAAEEEAKQLGFGGTDMTKEELRKVIDSDRRMYYRTEELNDKLYIHYKGWKNLMNLEGWTGLRALYAESNAFDKIQGLQMCRSLRSLFLQENCIKKIEGLDGCPDLWNLNLSNNFIERIEGLSNCKGLNTLVIAKNKIGLRGLADLEELVGSPIVSLDIQDNKIWDPDVLPEIFVHMPELRVLYLKGNPCAKKIPNYRKSTTVYCKELRYLDDRPVFEEDRRAAEAFNQGGLEEERAERKRIREEKNLAHERNMKAFQEMTVRVKEEKREREAMRREDKYTDDDDPGLTQQRYMKERHRQWEIDNADQLRDHEQERAERILKAEKEGRKEGVAEAGDTSMDSATETEAEETKEVKIEDTPLGDGLREQKVDNRKLVYEDIWDDVPPIGNLRSAKPAPQSSFQPAPRSASASAPAATAGGPAASSSSEKVVGFVAASSFQGARAGMAFKLGSCGLGYYPDGHQQVQPASTTPHAGATTEPGRSEEKAASAKQGNTWYSRYTDKMQETMGKLEADARSLGANPNHFAPPPRRPVVQEEAVRAPDAPAPPLAPPPPAAPVAPQAPAGRPLAVAVDSELQEMD